MCGWAMRRDMWFGEDAHRQLVNISATATALYEQTENFTPLTLVVSLMRQQLIDKRDLDRR